jgi:hypothetical protein
MNKMNMEKKQDQEKDKEKEKELTQEWMTINRRKKVLFIYRSHATSSHDKHYF